MDNIIFAQYDMDSGFVQAWTEDCNLILIDCDAVEKAFAYNMYQRSQLFTKILAYVSGNRSVTITDIEMKMAADALRRLADQRFDWTQEEREQYKAMASIIRYMR